MGLASPTNAACSFPYVVTTRIWTVEVLRGQISSAQIKFKVVGIFQASTHKHTHTHTHKHTRTHKRTRKDAHTHTQTHTHTHTRIHTHNTHTHAHTHTW